MKKIITLLLLSTFIMADVSGQTTKKPEDESNCYLKWLLKFEIRGANEVKDGTYNDVIITRRNGNDAECFNGKCDVKEGRVENICIKKEDNSYDALKIKVRNESPVTITNGMSKTIVTLEDELINVFFIKKIKPKKAGYVKAADPKDD